MCLFAFSIKHIFSSYCVHVFSFYNIKHHNGVTDHKTLTSLLNIKHHGCITNWLTAPLKILLLIVVSSSSCRSDQSVRVTVWPALLIIEHCQIHKYKYTNTQIHKYKYTNTNSEIHKCTNTQIHKYTKKTNTNTQMQVHKYTNT